MARMILDTAFLLDQVRHPRRGPQTGFIPQSLRTLFEPLLDLLELLGLRRGLRPARPAFFSPARPFSRSSAAH